MHFFSVASITLIFDQIITFYYISISIGSLINDRTNNYTWPAINFEVIYLFFTENACWALYHDIDTCDDWVSITLEVKNYRNKRPSIN